MRTALLAVMRKELRQTFRDRRMVAMLVVAPVLQLTLLGYAVDLDVDRIPTAVCDQDNTPESRDFVAGLLADGTLIKATDVAAPEAPLAHGEVESVVVLPVGFGRDLSRGRSAEVQVLVDGTDSIRAQVAVNTAVSFIQQRALSAAAERLAKVAALQGVQAHFPTVRVEPRILYNPRMRSPIYMVPGVAAMVLLIVTTVTTAMGIAREKEVGTIEQLMVTPIRPFVLLLGKILPFAAIGLVVAGLVLTVGTHLFDVPLRGSVAAIFVGTLCYLMATLGVGVFISTMATTQQQAILASFFFLMPAILLSGFMSPVESMPDWIRPITWLNPVRYYVWILRACLLKGAGFSDLALPMSCLFGFGAGILALSSIRFRKRLA